MAELQLNQKDESNWSAVEAAVVDSQTARDRLGNLKVAKGGDLR